VRRTRNAARVLLLAALPGLAALAAPGARAASVEESRRSAIVTAAQRVSPAVVSVSVVQTRTVQRSPFYSFFPERFFDDFFPQYRYRERVATIGSGFLAAPGIVVTNQHVVSGAEEVRVTLPDGRDLPARYLDGSLVHDLAFLRVEGSDLPVAPLGDSDDILVGEWAIAIGNPFGYLLEDTRPSVTAGVVSATHRDIKSEASEEGIYLGMIQTDAAINPGNSGGPLVNAAGQVIGVNTFIFSRSGGSIGIGFAVPINRVRRFLDEIARHHRIRDVWVGFYFQPVTPRVASHLGIPPERGLVVTRVTPESPADRAHLQTGDVVLRIDGREMRSVRDAHRVLYDSTIGDVLRLEVSRAGKVFEARLVFEEYPGRAP
jgi:serine protease Do